MKVKSITKNKSRFEEFDKFLTILNGPFIEIAHLSQWQERRPS